MLIVGDLGTDACNTDNVFAFGIGSMPDGTTVLIAHGLGAQTILAAVGDRPKRALEAIVKGIKERRLILDLADLLGPRPNLTVAKPGLVVPNGGKIAG